MKKPKQVTDEHITYLDNLRDSGITNMFGATRYLEDEFDLSQIEAREILKYWMKGGK